MTAPKEMPPLPDPSDPANLAWWQTYDRLDAIAEAAMRITLAAHAATHHLRAGHNPDLQLLAEELDQWLWHSRCLDIDDGASHVTPHRPATRNAR